MIKIRLLDFVKEFISPRTKIGGTETIIANITEEIYFKELAVYIAVSYIASAIAKCEFKVFENNEEVKNKEYFTLNLSPNLNETSSEFWYKIIEKMYYENEALVIESNGNLYCADSFSKEEFPMLGNKYSNITIGTLNMNKTYKADEVFLFKLENKDVKRIIDGLYSSYGKLLGYAIKKYKKSNAEKYKLKISSTKAGNEDFMQEFEETIKAQLKTFMESDSAVYPEFDGYDLVDMSPKNNSSNSSDVTALRKDIFEMVAQAFKIPQSLLTGNITNINDVVKVLITFGIDPIASTISEELSRKQGFEKWNKGNYIKIDTSTINHIDVLEVAEKVDKMISSGVLCIDEIREIIDRKALDTDFSKTHFITKNYDTASNALKGGDE
ncbi:phage portal protein [Sarcina ventriculi]